MINIIKSLFKVGDRFILVCTHQEPQIKQISQKGEKQRIERITRKEDIQEISQGPQIVRISRKGNNGADLDEYPYSSWHEYVGLGSDLPSVCEKPDACHNLTTEQWRELLSKPLPEGTKCLEPKEYRAPKPTETQVLSMIRLMTTATTWDEFKTIPRDEKLKTIKQLLQNGASIRQMEKLTGIGRGIIQNL